MKRAWTRGEKLLWAAPLLFLLVAGAMTFGSDIARRVLGWPQTLMTTPDTMIRSMALSRNGEILAAGGSRYDPEIKRLKSGSGTVHLWNARTGKPLAEIPPLYTRNNRGTLDGWDIYALALSPNAKTIGFSRALTNWNLYDVSTRKQLWTFPSFIQDAEFSHDGRSIVLSGDEKTWIVDASNGKVRTQWKRIGHSNSYDVDLSPDGKIVASIGPFGIRDPIGVPRANIELYRADNGKLIRSIESQHNRSVKFSPDSKKLVVASSKSQWSGDGDFDVFAPVRCYDVATGKILWAVKSPTFGGADSSHAAFCGAIFSPDGSTVAAYQNHRAKMFLLDSTTGEVKATRSVGRAESSAFMPYNFAFSPDGKRLFAPGKNAILYWNLD